MPKVASIAAAVAVPPVANAQTSVAENPELEPNRASARRARCTLCEPQPRWGMAWLSCKATIMGGGSEDAYQSLRFPI
jgi:hypothetical protein